MLILLLANVTGIQKLEYRIDMFSDFWEMSIWSSTIIYILSNLIGCFCPHILTSLCYCLIFEWETLYLGWGENTLWFLFAFVWWLVILSNFSCVCWPSMFWNWKFLVNIICSFLKFNCVVVFLSFLWMLNGTPLSDV